jgi:uridine kinase
LRSRLSAEIQALGDAYDRVAVAIDGPDAAGKTALADRLAEVLTGTVIRASVDSFHRPKAERWRRGSLSAAGYYHGSFDYEALQERLVGPFLAGAPAVRTATYDYREDVDVHGRDVPVLGRAVLIVDGIFLLRPELRAWWTLAVHLHVTPEESLRRALRRDGEYVESRDDLERRYRERYLTGQELYRAQAGPEKAAHVVVDNTDPRRPRVMRWSPPGGPPPLCNHG